MLDGLFHLVLSHVDLPCQVPSILAVHRIVEVRLLLCHEYLVLQVDYLGYPLFINILVYFQRLYLQTHILALVFIIYNKLRGGVDIVGSYVVVDLVLVSPSQSDVVL